MHRAFKLSVAVSIAASAAVPAGAQINDVMASVIGAMAAEGKEMGCLAGTLITREEIDEALASSQRSMQSYLNAVRSAPVVDASTLYTRKVKRREWIGTDAQPGDVKAIADPISRAAQAALPWPTSFQLANDEASARGVWTLIPAAAGQSPGSYVADFRHELGVWRITRLELVAATLSPPAVKPYCHVPGDIVAVFGEPARAMSPSPY